MMAETHRVQTGNVYRETRHGIELTLEVGEETEDGIFAVNWRGNRDQMPADDILDVVTTFGYELIDSEDDDVRADGGEDEGKEMYVTENGETRTFTRSEWESDRSTRDRLWSRLERNPGEVWVKIAHWFSDPQVNKVKVGKGFMARKDGETDKAWRFEVDPSPESHNAGTETVWIPKKAARVHELR